MRAFGLAMLAAAPAYADEVHLSGLFGVASGHAAVNAAPPLVPELSGPIYGIGIDCPGNFASTRIEFRDGVVFEHGLGQHPPETGQARVAFDLAALSRRERRTIEVFHAVVGIDIVSSVQNNGAVFDVVVDGVVVASRSIDGRLSPPVTIEASVAGARMLELRTTRIGSFNSNHACWGGAAVTLGAPTCPVDFNQDGFIDFFDYDDFVACFEVTSCPAGATADFNEDEFVDFFDYDAFVSAFESGC